tara:strand:- start:1107 stop:2078 length:972 start_codon:yes stop_codon:yes gene_type:complete
MNNKPIIIVCGEPNSIFSEIIVKSFKRYNASKPIILIGSYNLIMSQTKKINLKIKLNVINLKNNFFTNLSKKKINIIDINYKFKKPFEKISTKSNKYILTCFEKAFQIIKNNQISGLINGPISKENFLKGKYLGITEFLASKYKLKENYTMLIYNKYLSVSPITTHLPVSKISKNIKKKKIVDKILLIKNFYMDNFSKNVKIAVSGLNPHCENFFELSEEKKFIKPAINFLKKKKINIIGPISADTIFLKENSKKYDVIIGMYHDQVLTPIKALHGFNAINITLGLPYLRISPDHGPNFKMIGKNKSNPQSLIESIKFLDRLK